MKHKIRYGLSVFVLLSLMGCSDLAQFRCFTKRVVYPPDRIKVLANINTGQSGKDIVDAVYDGEYDRVKALLQTDPQLSKTEVPFDRNAGPKVAQYGDLLTFAVSQCDLEMINVLLDAGLSPDGVQKGSPLALALLADDPVMAELLLRRGASTDPQKQGGENVFSTVSAYGHVGAVMMLLRYGLDLNYEDEFGATHLHELLHKDIEMMKLLIEKGANPWRAEGTGAMPIQALAGYLADGDVTSPNAKFVLQLKADAESKGLPWPPPDIRTTRAMILKGEWPTFAALKAGVPPVTPTALAYMRKQFAKEIGVSTQ